MDRLFTTIFCLFTFQNIIFYLNTCLRHACKHLIIVYITDNLFYIIDISLALAFALSICLFKRSPSTLVA